MQILGEQKMDFAQVIDTCKVVPTRAEIVKNDTAEHSVWRPISHSHFVEALANGFQHHGLEITDSAFALNKTGHLLVGGFKVIGEMLPALPGGIDAQYEMLVRHSNNMSHGLQINAGLEIMVCTNGCIGGEPIARHKHTNQFDVDSWARDTALTEFVTDCFNQTKNINSLREMDCSDESAAKCILEAGSRGIIPLARTVDIWQEWNNPVFNTDDFALNTGWKLMNDFTHVAQKCSPARQLDIVQKVGPLVKEFCVNGALCA